MEHAARLHAEAADFVGTATQRDRATLSDVGEGIKIALQVPLTIEQIRQQAS